MDLGSIPSRGVFFCFFFVPPLLCLYVPCGVSHDELLDRQKCGEAQDGDSIQLFVLAKIMQHKHHNKIKIDFGHFYQPTADEKRSQYILIAAT